MVGKGKGNLALFCRHFTHAHNVMLPVAYLKMPQHARPNCRLQAGEGAAGDFSGSDANRVHLNKLAALAMLVLSLDANSAITPPLHTPGCA